VLPCTPEAIGSATWGHTNRRMVTSVRFRERATVSRAEIVIRSEDGQNPSDHFPVVVDLKLHGE
jgi:hypothetical protein